MSAITPSALTRVFLPRLFQGSLTEIDAILFAEMWLFEDHVLEDFPGLTKESKDAVCASLLACINIIRELLNAFSKQKDAEVRLAVMARLSQLRLMEQKYAACVRQHPSFAPPAAYADTELPQRKAADKKQKGKKDKDFAKPAKPDAKLKTRNPGKENAEPNDSSEALDADTSTTVDEVTPLDHHAHRYSLREMEFDVFELLQYRLISDVLDTNDNTSASQRRQIRIERPDVSFLLDDLAVKLKRSFHPPRSVPWVGTSDPTVGFRCVLGRSDTEVMKWVVRMMPCLCEHLESSCAFFQEILDDYDGVNDITIVEKHPGFPDADRCFRQLLLILSDAVSWSGFFDKAEEGSTLLSQLLSELANRTEAKSQRTPSQLLVDSFHYLEQFAAPIATVDTYIGLLQLLVNLRDLLGTWRLVMLRRLLGLWRLVKAWRVRQASRGFSLVMSCYGCGPLSTTTFLATSLRLLQSALSNMPR